MASSLVCQDVLAEPVFRCVTASRKTIEVTPTHAVRFVYYFGRVAFPEMVFEAPQDAVDVQKWSGIGCNQSYGLGIRHEDAR